jgi:HSP20 family protein
MAVAAVGPAMSGRSNPFDEVERLLDRMNAELGSAGGDVAVDVEERDDEYVVTADLPGFEGDDVAVTLDEGVLDIEAERDETREEATGEFLRRERTRESVRRSVRVPGEVDAERTEARYRNGVLTVRLPKSGGDGGRRIEVE